MQYVCYQSKLLICVIRSFWFLSFLLHHAPPEWLHQLHQLLFGFFVLKVFLF